MAVKVTGVPLVVDGVGGAMLILVKVAAVTVILAAVEVTPLIEAVMVVVPIAAPVTIPVAMPTLAVAGAAEVQVTWVVMSALVPLEYVPVAA